MLEEVDEFEGAPDDGGVTQELADGHGQEHNPGVGAHITQGDTDGEVTIEFS